MTTAFGSALPGTASARRAYPPPVPVGTPHDPGGQDAATRALRRQRQVADLYSRWRAAHSPDINPDILKDNAGAFSVSDAALTLPGALDGVKADADAADQKVNDLLRSSRVGDDTASQLAAQRYWDRAQRTLDSQKDGAKVVAAARDLIENASAADVPVLSEELSSYLATRSLPTDWLSGALANKIPGLADATADATLKARQLAVIAANHQKLQRAMQSDTDVPALIDPGTMNSTPYSDGSA
jgi:hypothetical protein